MSIKEADGDYNRQTALSIIEKHSSADFYLLPELWTSGYCQTKWQQMAEQDTPKALDFMSQIAKKFNAWICGSLIFLDEKHQLRNRLFMFNRQGLLAGHYDKAHLFPLMEEDKYMEAGAFSPVIDVEGFKIAPTICYDLRFPEMYRRTLLRGVDVFLVSAEWPDSRKHIMATLAQARAMESQAYLILSNRVGTNAENDSFGGHSMIIGPTGIMISAEEQENTAVMQTLSPTDHLDIRANLPTLSHRVAGIDYD